MAGGEEEFTIRPITAILRGCIEEEREVKDTENKRAEPVGKKPDMSEGACIAPRHRNYAMDQQQEEQFLAQTNHTTMFVV